MRSLLISTVSIILFAVPLGATTLEEAVDQALKNSPELQAFRLETGVGQGRLEWAKLPLIFNPVLEGSVVKKGESSEPGARGFTDYGVKLSQEFEIAGQRGVRIDIAQKDISRIDLEIKDRERILVNEVKNAFARVLAGKKREELTREAVKLKEDLLGFTRIKFQAGQVSGLEVNLAEVEVSKTKRELLLATRENREALLSLQRLLGMRPDEAFSTQGELSDNLPGVPDRESLKKLAALRRPDIKAASIEIDRTASAQRLVNKLAIPNITLSGFYDRDEERNVGGISLSVPLSFFDRKQAEKREALVRAEQARLNYIGLERTVEKEVEATYSDFSSAFDELSLFRGEILNKATGNLNLINIAFKEGKIGFFDVRLAQKDTIDLQFAHLDALLRARLALNALENISGGTLP
ncbi:MAG: TolC family protein [Desulfuromonadaceae bacterium]